MQMKIFPARERSASTWKNGKGVTREVAIHPQAAGLDDFDWRVSLAEVTQSNSFSSFPGVDRTLAVLNGTLLLRIGAQPVAVLSADSRPVSFRGDEPCHAEIEGRVVQDLNVMTRRGRFSSQLTLIEVYGPMTICVTTRQTLILALDDAFIETGHSQAELAPLDAVLLETSPKKSGWRACAVQMASARASSRLYVIDLIKDL